MRTYLLRTNLDIKDKKIEETLRFRVAVDSIKSLIGKNSKVVILAHRGRPTHSDKSLSLKSFVAPIRHATGKKVVFINELEKAKQVISKSAGDTIFLLENLRFYEGERKNSSRFAKRLAELGDVYINNDFATSHRESASLTAITKHIPSREGEAVKREITILTKAIKNPKKPFILIVGGAKAKDKAGVIKKLLPKVDAVLLGGGAGNTFLKANGFNIKKSLYEPELIKEISKFARHRKIKIPIDYIESDNKILDIGPKTRKEYAKIIKSAKTIVWAGPMGKFEEKKFSKGNEAVARSVLKNKKARTVIGGADTVASLPVKIKKQTTGNIFFSTGGGAMLDFLAGKELPALAALKQGEPRQGREAIKRNKW